MLIYHVALPADWAKYKGRPSYQTESLQSEGFIHCSYPNQLSGVLKRYFSNAAKVVVLTIDTEKLRSKLIAETSTGGDTFPHIYGRLNHDAIVSADERDLRSTSDSLADFA
jgi:uncharacterized protein (DUF952 family)